MAILDVTQPLVAREKRVSPPLVGSGSRTLLALAKGTVAKTVVTALVTTASGSFFMFSSKHLLTTSWATVELEKEWRRVKAVAQHGSRHVSKAATFTLKVNSLHFLLLLWKQWLWQYAKDPSNYAFAICRPVSGPLTNNHQQPFTTIQGIPIFHHNWWLPHGHRILCERA